jgi:cell division transport system ATP-binding protein
MQQDEVVILEQAKVAKDGITILSGINFQLKAGEFVYIIGKTGTGKSSFLKLLYAELPFIEGKGTVCGISLNLLKRKDLSKLRRKEGIIFQDFELLTDRSVSENLTFVLEATGWKEKKRIQNRIQEVLELVGLENKGYKMPHELSGGEQQRVVISRALLNDPLLILADEPTGNLDPETSLSIFKLLHAIAKNGTAVIMATHDYSALKQFPARIVECVDQALVEFRGNMPEN